MTVKERALLLGPQQSLLAIVSEPERPPGSRPTILVLNAGIVHRVGAHRKSVNLARALCAAGFRVVRFDLSGIGDSPARRDALGFADSALADLAEIMDDLGKRHGETRFVLMGLCSGADNSFEMATRDPRVVGAILLDGVAYRTPRFYLHKYGPRLRRRSAWITAGKQAAQLARRRLARVLGQEVEGGEVDAAPQGDAVRDFAPREETVAKLQALCDRGVKMYWLYTAGAPSYYNYREQFFDCFKDVDLKGVVTHDYFAESNHTFTELRTQRKLIAAVTGWAARAFPG
jgi:pimeloyl-ACP methyl ester carboxylesterase